jgi:vitamin B12 transporter
MAIIDREDIERQNAPDLAHLLQETLNLNIARYGAYGSQTSIHLRGYSSRRVAFLIDGVPVNSPLDGRFDINQIDLNSIERIEVIYGGSDSKFNVSGALGGVINIITVRRQEPGWRFSGSISNTSTMPGEYRDRSGEIQGPHWEDLFDTQNIALSAAYGSSEAFGGNAFSFRAGKPFTFITDSSVRSGFSSSTNCISPDRSRSITKFTPPMSRIRCTHPQASISVSGLFSAAPAMLIAKTRIIQPHPTSSSPLPSPDLQQLRNWL